MAQQPRRDGCYSNIDDVVEQETGPLLDRTNTLADQRASIEENEASKLLSKQQQQRQQRLPAVSLEHDGELAHFLKLFVNRNLLNEVALHDHVEAADAA